MKNLSKARIMQTPDSIARMVQAVKKATDLGNPVAKVLADRIAGKPSMEQSRQMGLFYQYCFQLLMLLNMAMNSKFNSTQFGYELDKLIVIERRRPDDTTKQSNKDDSRENSGKETG